MTTATKYKPYPKYRSSGIDWLGKIPDGWEAKRLRYYFDYHAGGVWGEEENGNGNNMICFRVADFDFDHFGLAENNLTVRNIPENQHSRILEKGDILLEKSGGGEKQTVGRAVRFDLNARAVCSNFIEKLTPLKVHNPKFISYLMGALYFQTINIRSIKQTTGIQNLDLYSFLCEVVPFPSKESQKSIADFLERETAKIDKVVGRKQKLIELLKEKRQALITRAVTKGLDPKAKMKPSGIDWLGDIPEEWESWKISHLFNKIGSGTTPPSENMDYYEGDIPWVITGELKDNEIFDSENKVTKKAVQELSALRIFPKNSLLIAMYGATIGKMAILRIPATTNQACCVLGDSKLIDVDFAFYYFLAFRPHLIALSYGGGQPNISQDTIRSIKIFLPALTKQKEIVAFLDGKTAKIDEIIKRVEMQIEKLQEYRQALILNAVTGKIQV